MTDGPVHPLLWAVVVTFHRPAELTNMLAKLAEQTRPPDRVIVVDNGSQPDARHAADEGGATYLDAGDNLGPAGGIALGMQHVLDRADDRDWVVLCDDDDPPVSNDLLGTLWAFAADCRDREPRTAAVGLSGARYDRRWGVFRRVPDEELHGAVRVDYVGGGQFPLYSCRVVRECGVPDPGFFFGFDDAEYGLRLRRSGYAVFVPGELWRVQRTLHGRLRLSRAALRTGHATPAWRRYYAVRNTTLLARRHGSPFAVAYAAGGGAARAALALLRAGRPAREVGLPWRGAVDGLAGRTGRTVDPGMNVKASGLPEPSDALPNPEGAA